MNQILTFKKLISKKITILISTRVQPKTFPNIGHKFVWVPFTLDLKLISPNASSSSSRKNISNTPGNLSKLSFQGVNYNAN